MTGDHDLKVGDRVVDSESDPGDRSAAIVVELPDETAQDHFVEAIGATIADVNPEFDPESPIAVVAFERAIPHDGTDDADSLAALDENVDVTTYSYPVGRLETVPESWEPAPASGARKRRAIHEEHGEAIDVFADVLETLLTDADAVEQLINAHERRRTPSTRGGCRYTRDDRYRPDDEEAIVCWECSEGRRPEKFMCDDPAGPACQKDDLAVWGLLADFARKHAGERFEPAGVTTDYPANSFSRDLEAIRNGDDRDCRTSAVRLAYSATLGGRIDDPYNYNRAVALLRDRGVDTDALLPGGDRR